MPRQAPYLQRRGYGLTFRIAIPPDLRAIVGVREITKALPTTDRSEATPLALKYAACAKRMFWELRAGMATPNQEALRLVAQLAKEKIRQSDLKEEKEQQEFAHADELQKVRQEAARQIELVKLQAENEAMRRVLAGFSAPSVVAHSPAPASAPAASVVPPVAAPAKPLALHRLSEVIPAWKRLKSPALSTIDIYEGAISRFEGHFPELHAETIEKRHIRDYIAWLQSEKLSGKTIEKEHGVIRALLTIAEHEEWVSSNVAKGALLPETNGMKVRSYTPEECKQVFSSPVFTAGERPTGCMGDAAYWIPLLLLFTGARREEISQLTVERVRASEGVHYLAIDPIDEEGRLKTDESKRAVPIHADLLKLGFLDFVEQRRRSGGVQLFEKLKPNKRGQYGAKWGDWWRRYVREVVGIADERLHPAHSFRHLFVTECRRLNFRNDYERALVGHTRGSGKKDAHDDYGEYLVSSLAMELNRINFRGLDLSHLITP